MSKYENNYLTGCQNNNTQAYLILLLLLYLLHNVSDKKEHKKIASASK